MRELLLVAALAGCGPGLAKPRFDDDAKTFTAATAAHDAKALRAMMKDSVVNGGLVFADAACATFTTPGEVKGPQLDELAGCIAGLGLVESTRKDALPDVEVMTYPPGFEVEVRLAHAADGVRLAWIGFAARRDGEMLPTITPEALEKLRTAGEPAPAIASNPVLEHDIEINDAAFAWFKLCLGADGAITSAQVRAATSPTAARTFSEVIKDWKFKPFEVAGQALPVCAMVEIKNPPNATAEALPLPTPSRSDEVVLVPIKSLGTLVQGDKLVVPSDDDKVRLQKAGLLRLVGSYLFCIDETGKVADAHAMRATGLPGYDERILRAIHGWAYKPYLDEGGKPVALCSIATFIYSQH